MTSYERPNVRAMEGYVPGKQPADPSVVKLNTNENPYPPSEAAMEALASTSPEDLRKYPPPMADGFREAAAELHGVDPDQVMAVNGGDELLRLAIATYVQPGSPIGIFDPSYSLYPVLAQAHGSPVHRIAIEEGWRRPERSASELRSAGVQLTFLVNPHAPSGTLESVSSVLALADALDSVLLVDEAYVDFVDPDLGHDLATHVASRENLVLLRTMSKGYSLAGLRFGYAIGARGLIEPMLLKTRDSYNVDAVAQRVATAALRDREHAERGWERIRGERRRLREALGRLGLESPPSQSNFLLCGVPGGAGRARALHAELEERGLLVRYFGSDPRLSDKLRITIGTPEQNDVLLEALDALMVEVG